jgi:hypothetical protein
MCHDFCRSCAGSSPRPVHPSGTSNSKCSRPLSPLPHRTRNGRAHLVRGSCRRTASRAVLSSSQILSHHSLNHPHGRRSCEVHRHLVALCVEVVSIAIARHLLCGLWHSSGRCRSGTLLSLQVEGGPVLLEGVPIEGVAAAQADLPGDRRRRSAAAQGDRVSDEGREGDGHDLAHRAGPGGDRQGR